MSRFPEEVIDAHILLKGKLLLPIHWGTFNLAYHDWYDPPDRLVKKAKEKNINLVIPKPGQIIDVENPPELTQWWNDFK